MSHDGGHRLAEIGPTELLAEISRKYYELLLMRKAGVILKPLPLENPE